VFSEQSLPWALFTVKNHPQHPYKPLIKQAFTAKVCRCHSSTNHKTLPKTSLNTISGQGSALEQETQGALVISHAQKRDLQTIKLISGRNILIDQGGRHREERS